MHEVLRKKVEPLEPARFRKNSEIKKKVGGLRISPGTSESAWTGQPRPGIQVARLRKKVKLRKKVGGLQISPCWPRRDPPRLESPGQATIPSRFLVLVSQIEKKKVKLRKKVGDLQ